MVEVETEKKLGGTRLVVNGSPVWFKGRIPNGFQYMTMIMVNHRSSIVDNYFGDRSLMLQPLLGEGEIHLLSGTWFSAEGALAFVCHNDENFEAMVMLHHTDTSAKTFVVHRSFWRRVVNLWRRINGCIPMYRTDTVDVLPCANFPS